MATDRDYAELVTETSETIENLRIENERLRMALEKIARMEDIPKGKFEDWREEIARAALDNTPKPD